MPVKTVRLHHEDLVAEMGLLSAGWWLQKMVSIDAALVLSGAVLTAYVGVTGLILRMTLDRCLPQFLLQQNKYRGTNHWIIALFFGLCCSILTTSGGSVRVLAGVYTISFRSHVVVRHRQHITQDQTRTASEKCPGELAVRARRLVCCLNCACRQYYAVTQRSSNFCSLLRGRRRRRCGYVHTRSVIEVFIGHHGSRRQESRNEERKTEPLHNSSNSDRINRFQIVYFTKGDDLATLNRAAVYVLASGSLLVSRKGRL